jgi:hypothetical protein
MQIYFFQVIQILEKIMIFRVKFKEKDHAKSFLAEKLQIFCFDKRGKILCGKIFL